MSKAVFLSDQNGEIDIDKDISLQGDFLGKDSLGLFYSLDTNSVFPAALKFEDKYTDYDMAYRCVQVVKDDKLVAFKKFSMQLFDSLTIKHKHIEEGSVLLDMYIVNDSKKMLLILGGSEGGNESSKFYAKLFASKNYNTCAISYFKNAAQGYTLQRIPIERIDSSIMKIEKYFGDLDKIYLMGASRGAELALIYSSLRPRINAVFAFAPSNVVFPGINGFDVPSWLYKGEVMNFFSMPKSYKVVFDKYNRKIYTDSYRNITGSNTSESAIKVENIEGDILLFSGKDDQLWPATKMADEIEIRLSNYSFEYKFHNYQYENVGHFVSPSAYLPTKNETGPYAIGGKEKENAYAIMKNWQIMNEYLEKNF